MKISIKFDNGNFLAGLITGLCVFGSASPWWLLLVPVCMIDIPAWAWIKRWRFGEVSVERN